MSELLVILVFFLLLLLAGVIAQWFWVSSLSARLSATQGRLNRIERDHLKRIDRVSGRLGRVEGRAGGVAGSATAETAPDDPSDAASADAVTTPDVPAADETPATLEEPNATIAGLLRAQAEVRASMASADAVEAEAESEPAAPVEAMQPSLQGSGADRGAGIPAAGEDAVKVTEADPRPVAGKQASPTVGRHAASAPTPAARARASAGLRGLSFEQLLGGKVFVWLGAIALVLTGAFLLRYGFEKGWITEPMRVISAGVFGCVLIGAAYWLRERSAGIAEAVCAAGVTVLFGTIYAGQNLYELIPPGWGYALLVLVTAGAVVLSLRFGPLVALLGLVGGFALPPILGGDLPGRPAMVVYLLALELGVLAVTRKRGWLGISALTLLGSVLWALSYVVLGGGAVDRGFTAALVMATSVIFILNATFAQARSGQGGSRLTQTFWLALGAAGSAAALLSLLVVTNGYSGQDLVMLWLMVAGALVLARWDGRYTPIAWVSAGLSAVVVLGAGWAAWRQASGAAWWLASAMQERSALDVLLLGALAFGLLIGVGGYAAQWWPTRRRVFVLMSALAGPVFLAVSVLGSGWLLGFRGHWWLWSLSVALVYALAAWPLVWRGVLRPGADRGAQRGDDVWSASVFGLVSIVLGALAIGQGLDHPWTAVGWAMLGALSAVLGWRLRLPVLLRASAALAVLSAAVLVMPGPFMFAVAGGAVFNTLLVVYGLSACAYGVIAFATHRAGRADLSEPMQGLSASAIVWGAVLLVRDAFHPGAFVEASVLLYEWPTYAVVLLTLGLLFSVAARRLGLLSLGMVASFTGMLGALLSVAGPVAFGNPLLYSDAGGASLAWGMLYLYALPAAMVFVFARALLRSDEDGAALVMRVFGVGLVSALLVMQVRNGFNWSDLHRPRVGFYERGTYGLALLGLAWVLFSYALVFGSVFAKRASRVVAAIGMGVAVAIMGLFGNPLLDPALVGGAWLVFGLCYAFVLPAAVGWLYAQVIDPNATDEVGRLLRLGALTLTTLFVGLQVRNGFHFANIHDVFITRNEWATYGLGWMLLGAALVAAARWLTDPALLKRSGFVVALMGVAVALLGTVLIENPLWTHATVGDTPVFNGLWYLYAPTIVALALFARRLRLRGERGWAHAVGGGAVAMGFLLLSLLVRQGFMPDGDLHLARAASFNEWYAYSLAWVVFGVGLLAAGVWSGLDTLRYGSLAVMLLAVAKVFALDTAELAGLLRVFSFLGLGVTLLLLGYTYQRFVFRKPAAPDETSTDHNLPADQPPLSQGALR